MTTSIHFYTRLDTVLTELGWSPATLAKNTGISHSVISRWRHLGEKKLPHNSSLERVVAATGASMAYLTTGQLPAFTNRRLPGDLESLAMVWGTLPSETRNKIFRLAGTYPFAAEARSMGAERSSARAKWICEKAAEYVGVDKVGDEAHDFSEPYINGEVSEDEFYWLCVKHFVDVLEEQIGELLNS